MVSGRWCRRCARTTRCTIEQMQQLADSRGGQCLSERYVNGTTKLRWQCARRHTWEAAPRHVRAGTWCPRCAVRVPGPAQDIETMRAHAAQHGGLCLSACYEGARAKLQWQCALGHRWDAQPRSILAGSWCPVCAGAAPYTLDDMQKLARERGGQCLSKQYDGRHKPLQWRCAAGHDFAVSISQVRLGRWCPVCRNGRDTRSIAQMKELANRRGGTCLSTRMASHALQLSFRCGDGHQWRATPEEVRGGAWCPRCAAAE